MNTITVTVRRLGMANAPYTFEAGVALKTVLETAGVSYREDKQSLTVNGQVVTEVSVALNEDADILITPKTGLA